MSLKNAHKFIGIYVRGLILHINALYMLSCFLKLFALVGKELINRFHLWHIDLTVVFLIYDATYMAEASI